ncbi:MAG: hypothetical protein JNL90_04095 [Planctomycetes bacterium]|nr:hypothetical protein [Planctomycetota bacterium]
MIRPAAAARRFALLAAAAAPFAPPPRSPGNAPFAEDAPVDGAIDAALDALSSSDPLLRERARRDLFHAQPIERLAAAPADLDDRAWRAQLELLLALAPAEARPLALQRRAAADPGVRALAALALARAGEPWPVDAIAALLVDRDCNVAQALLDGLARHSLPVRRRFAAAFAAPLDALCHGPDPTLLERALELRAADDRDATGAQLLALLPTLPSTLQDHLAERVATLAPAWEAATLRAFSEAYAAGRVDADGAGGPLALRLAVRYQPERAAALDEAALRELLAQAGLPPSPLQEHAAAALLELQRVAPASAARAVALLPSLEREPPFDGALEGALDVAFRLDGRATLDLLLAQLVAPREEPGRALPWFAPLARLPYAAVARRLDEEVAPRLAPPLRAALCETALHLPAGEPRNRLLLHALRDLHGDARLRPFEAIARSGDSALLGFLIDALDGERDARTRGRMIEQLAESFGASDPDELLALVERLWRKPAAESDRLAALEGVPFIALQGASDAVAREAIERFGRHAVEALLHVLAQVGGAAAEAWFEQQAGALRADAEAVDLYRFCLSRAGRLGGPRMRELLRVALDDARPPVREAALRALVEAGDPLALEAAPRVLRGLDPARRIPLLADLGKLRHLPGYAALVTALLSEAEDEESRMALLELAEPALREALLPVALARLAASDDAGERHGVLEALGRLGGTEARALLETRVAAALELPAERWRDEEPQLVEARTALLALASADPTAATAPCALLLLRDAAIGSEAALERAALGLPTRAPPADPTLVALLAQRPPEEAVAALDAAWAGLGPRAARCDERFFAEAGAIAERAHAPPELRDWFDRRVLTLWPAASASDFRALLPIGPRRELLRRGAVATAAEEAALLADLPALLAALGGGEVAPRDRLDALGRSDPLLGSSPARTLAVLAALAEAGGAGGPERAFAAALREAIECPPLLAEVAAWGGARGLAPPPEFAARLASPRPDDADWRELRRRLDLDRR